MKNILYENRNIEYLTDKRRLKPVTVCISAICDAIPNGSPKIVLCADRLVSSGIQFEGGESKIKRITPSCYAMVSSNDSSASDLILERTKEKVLASGHIDKIKDIVLVLQQECRNYHKECLERDVLSKYNEMIEILKLEPKSFIEKATKEVQDYDYPLECEFIIAGLEPSKEAHIYWVSQNGEYRLEDSLGFTTIGSGGGLAFLQMTKYSYARNKGFQLAIPLVYFAKKIAERAEGVGRSTDLAVLHYREPPRSDNKPRLLVLSVRSFLKKLNATYKTIQANELKEMQKIINEVKTLF